MRCPETAKIWIQEDLTDPQRLAHLAGCPACRAEADHVARLQAMLTHLPQADAPLSVDARLRTLAVETGEQRLSCERTLDLLEAWREDELDAVGRFLVDDHLLWCPACAHAAEAADTLSVLLHGLPTLTPPDAIAERIAHARLPWWRRLLPSPAPRPAWGRVLPVAGAMAAAMLLLTFSLQSPPPNQDTTAKLPRSVSPSMPAPPRIHYTTPVGPFNRRIPGDITVASVPHTGAPPACMTVHEEVATDIVVPVAAPRTPQSMDKADMLLSSLLGASRKPAPPWAVRPAVDDEEIAAKPGSEMTPVLMAFAPGEPSGGSPEVVYVATARDALVNITREEALAQSEESLSALPDSLRIASAMQPPVRVAMPPSTDEISKSLSLDLRDKTLTKPAPITLRDERSLKRPDGVLFTIQ